VKGRPTPYGPTNWRVVSAGDPNLMPDVTVGFSGSKGMPFLLQVTWARPSAASKRPEVLLHHHLA
jgi:hypothetical protein